MNESSAYLWTNVVWKEVSENDLVTLLTEQYDVDEETAFNDAQALIQQWLEAGIIEE